MTVYHWEMQRRRREGLWVYAGQAGAEVPDEGESTVGFAVRLRAELRERYGTTDEFRVVVWDVPGAGADPVCILPNLQKDATTEGEA